jgi:hypothetical protein
VASNVGERPEKVKCRGGWLRCRPRACARTWKGRKALYLARQIRRPGLRPRLSPFDCEHHSGASLSFFSGAASPLPRRRSRCPASGLARACLSSSCLSGLSTKLSWVAKLDSTRPRDTRFCLGSALMLFAGRLAIIVATQAPQNGLLGSRAVVGADPRNLVVLIVSPSLVGTRTFRSSARNAARWASRVFADRGTT